MIPGSQLPPPVAPARVPLPPPSAGRDGAPISDEPDKPPDHRAHRLAVFAASGTALVLVVLVAVWWDGRGAGGVSSNRGARRDDHTVEISELWDVEVRELRELAPMAAVELVASNGDVAVFSFATDDDARSLVAFDIATGDRRWTETTRGDADRATMVATDEMLLVGSTVRGEGDLRGDPRLDAYELSSGDHRWFEDDVLAVSLWLVAGDLVLALVDPDARRLVARDAASGDQRWERTGDDAWLPVVARANGFVFAEGEPDDPEAQVVAVDRAGAVLWTRTGDVAVRRPDVHGESAEIVPLFDGDTVRGVELATGHEQWSAPIVAHADALSRSMITAPGEVVVACTERDGEALGITVIGLADGGVRWTDMSADEDSALLGVVDDAVLTGASPHSGCAAFNSDPLVVDRVQSRDARDGHVRWTVDPEGVAHLTGSVGAPDSEPDALVLFDRPMRSTVDLRTGERLDWGPDQSNGASSELLPVDGGVVALRAVDGTTWEVVEASDPAAIRQVSVPADASFVGYADGVVYLHAGDRLLAID